MALVVKNLPAIAGDLRHVVQYWSQEEPLEEGMATHSSIPAWRIPWTEEPGGLQSVELQRIRHDFVTKQQYQIGAVSSSPPKKTMAPHSSTPAWRIPWMEEPDGLQSMGSLRVRHD